MKLPLFFASSFLLVIVGISRLSPTTTLAQTPSTYWSVERDGSNNLNFSFTNAGVNGTKFLQIKNSGIVAVNGGFQYGSTNNMLQPGALNIGDYTRSYGNSSGTWSANTAGLLMETSTNTEIMVHDTPERLSSLLYYEGDAVNRISIGRATPQGPVATLNLNGNIGVGTTTPNGKFEIVGGTWTDGMVMGPGMTMDNNFTIQTHIDSAYPGSGWANRTTYAGGISNNLALQPDVGTVSIGGTSGDFGIPRLNVIGKDNIQGSNIAVFYPNNRSVGIGIGFYDIRQIIGGQPINLNAGTTGSVNIGNTSSGPITLGYAGGNVGIGITTPNRKLDIGNGADGITFGQVGDNTETIQSYIDGHWADRVAYAAGCCNLLYLQPDVGQVIIGGTASSGVKFEVNGSADLGSSTAGALRVATIDGLNVNLRPARQNGGILISDDSGQYARGTYFQNGGNLGIGTNTPQGKLAVGFGNGDQLMVYQPYDDALAIQTTLNGQPNNGYGADTANRLMLQPTTGYVSIGHTNPQGKLDILAGGDDTVPAIRLRQNNAPAYGVDMGIDNNVDGGLYFYSVNNSAQTLAMDIRRDNAYVGIGMTAPAARLSVLGSNNTTDAFRVYNAAQSAWATIYTDAAGQGYFQTQSGYCVLNTAGTLNCNGGISDRRLKENIRPTSKGLKDLLNIEVDDYNLIKRPGHSQTGFIAQQLESIFPDAVTVPTDLNNPEKDPYMVEYGRVTPLIVKSVQEMNQKIENQQSEIEYLKKEIEELKRR